jgi:ABC-2 type transport system ATP-binding protein
MSDDTVIKVNKVYKNFKLPHEKTNSLKSIFTNLYKKRAKSYEIQHALKNISFEIKKGEFFGIVGRNGSGKSTLLKIIAEIYQPTKGSLQKSGKLVPFIELGVGFNPELTGRENVYLNGALLGFTTREVDDQYNDIVQFAELEQFMDQKLKNYSSGMQVRLAFAVATRAKADILLIDEVLAVGDADFQRKCFNYFRSLKNSSTTVIFVSHDMGAVREYCDRALLIDNSEIVDMGETDKIAQLYTKLFIDDDPQSQDGDNVNRWGSGGVSTTNIKVVATDASIKIEQVVSATVEIENPVIGFRIRSTSGADVTGTNTKIENKKVGTIKVGQSVTVRWAIPNILADGEYFIDPAVSAPNGLEVLDWWDEAVTLVIKKSRKLPYTIDPNFEMEVSAKP